MAQDVADTVSRHPDGGNIVFGRLDREDGFAESILEADDD
jgi:hypothetical protein